MLRYGIIRDKWSRRWIDVDRKTRKREAAKPDCERRIRKSLNQPRIIPRWMDSFSSPFRELGLVNFYPRSSMEFRTIRIDILHRQVFKRTRESIANLSGKFDDRGNGSFARKCKANAKCENIFTSIPGKRNFQSLAFSRQVRGNFNYRRHFVI